MITGEIGVNALVKFAVARIAHVESFVAAIIFRKLLFDDVGFDGDAEMVSLAGEVGGKMEILVFLESAIAQIAPQNSSHTELVRFGKSTANFDDLAVALFRAKV